MFEFNLCSYDLKEHDMASYGLQNVATCYATVL